MKVLPIIKLLTITKLIPVPWRIPLLIAEVALEVFNGLRPKEKAQPVRKRESP
jgi:hypothetical protein